MYQVKTTSGAVRVTNRRTLEHLRMLADWQLRDRGFDPTSVTIACMRADAADARAVVDDLEMSRLADDGCPHHS